MNETIETCRRHAETIIAAIDGQMGSDVVMLHFLEQMFKRGAELTKKANISRSLRDAIDGVPYSAYLTLTQEEEEK